MYKRVNRFETVVLVMYARVEQVDLPQTTYTNTKKKKKRVKFCVLCK